MGVIAQPAIGLTEILHIYAISLTSYRYISII